MEQIIRFMERTNVDSGTQAGNHVPVGDFFSIVIVAFVRPRSTRQAGSRNFTSRGGCYAGRGLDHIHTI
jgi:hypothetical protein